MRKAGWRRLRPTTNRLGRLTAGLFLLGVNLTASAASNQWSDAQVAGRQLVRQLLDRQPAENFTNSGVLEIRDWAGRSRTIPVQFQTAVTPSNWVTVYFTKGAVTNLVGHLAGSSFEYLRVVHADDRPNVYLAARKPPPPGGTNGLLRLAGDQTMVPFANSDFWLADLGLEFLHWPDQKILKHQMRRGRACQVLESRIANPAPNGYSRVVSWIDNESGGIVQAEAYDGQGRLLKEFYPKDFKKVNGQWEMGEMEMINDQTDSRTWIKFDLKGH